MKKFIALCAITMSFGAYASCTEDFNKGISEYEFAMNYFDSGASAYQAAVDESRGQGRRSVVCANLLKSTTGFDVATKSFTNCTSAFGSAVNSCSGQSSTVAGENQAVCSGNLNVASNNYRQALLTLKRTCFISKKSAVSEIQEEIDSIE
ncbi:hypothetical protein A9Q84_19575 [Halobacteriovorax marinus]|uniref:Lipoprotein n=1 Tax=Halobacteriovorax marinus TaxID=97084 RepID=A0A1Y5F8E3_9BACT|nr:hypothetical protein A9Q84_19575 [Halobacteriovorax marinus]